LAPRSNNTNSKSDGYVLPEWFFEFVRIPLRHAWRILFRIRFIGIEHIPPSGGLIVAANHQTYIDPFWLGIPFKRPLRYLAWDEAFKWPVVGKFIRAFVAWPLQLEGSDPAAIRRTLQWLSEGGAIVIFPEGGRETADGALLKFKAGAVRLAIEAGVPILPVTIRGGNRVWPRGQHLPRLATVEIIYHPLFAVEKKVGEETRAAARRESERLAGIIGGTLSN